MADENQLGSPEKSPPVPPPLSLGARWFWFKGRIEGRISRYWKKRKDNVAINLLIIFAFLSVAIGLAVFVIFLLKLSNEYTIYGTGIEIEKTGQVGDFVGGVVGAVWSLTGVLLFYAALHLQRKELKDNRLQFQLNRLTDVIYRQVDLCNRAFELFTLKEIGKEHRGRAALILLKRMMESSREMEKQFRDGREKEEWLPRSLMEIHSFIRRNESELARLYETLNDYIATVRISLAKEAVPSEDLNELKGIFFRNIGLDFLNSSELLLKYVEGLIAIDKKQDKDFDELFSDLCAIKRKIGLMSQFRNLLYDKEAIESELANRDLYNLHT
jgi:hypothetical protein